MIPNIKTKSIEIFWALKKKRASSKFVSLNLEKPIIEITRNNYYKALVITRKEYLEKNLNNQSITDF